MSVTTLELRVSGMHCGSCALLIDDVLADLPGVLDSRTSLKKGSSTVQLDAARTNVAEVLAAIAEEGYTATVVEAAR